MDEPDASRANIERKLGKDMWMNEELDIPTPITFED